VESGAARLSTAALEGGKNHIVSLLVSDKEGETRSAEITVTVLDLPDAPEIEFVRPIEGETVTEGVPFRFEALVSDAKEPAEDLLVEFETNGPEGAFCTPTVDSSGTAACESSLSVGVHVLTYRVTDSEGFVVETLRSFTVTSRDADGDGFEDAELGGNDCDDGDEDIYPGAPESCNGIDDDCDTTIDEGTLCYDDDGDGWAEADGDCDDSQPASFPTSPEIEDGYDNDCDGFVDEGTPAFDDDGDGYSERGGDCNDGERLVNPGATEVCDSIDNDCDTSVDEINATGCTTWYMDYDGDGFGSTLSECRCAPGGYYTSTYSNDCYDYNSSANITSTSWYTNNRGDGSFDYNCDGSQDRRYTAGGGCGSWPTCNVSNGWAGSTPSCGTSAAWVSSCATEVWFTCTENTTPRSQECH
jgi:hypothetical protein